MQDSGKSESSILQEEIREDSNVYDNNEENDNEENENENDEEESESEDDNDDNSEQALLIKGNSERVPPKYQKIKKSRQLSPTPTTHPLLRKNAVYGQQQTSGASLSTTTTTTTTTPKETIAAATKTRPRPPSPSSASSKSKGLFTDFEENFFGEYDNLGDFLPFSTKDVHSLLKKTKRAQIYHIILFAVLIILVLIYILLGRSFDSFFFSFLFSKESTKITTKCLALQISRHQKNVYQSKSFSSLLRFDPLFLFSCFFGNSSFTTKNLRSIMRHMS